METVKTIGLIVAVTAVLTFPLFLLNHYMEEAAVVTLGNSLLRVTQ